MVGGKRYSTEIISMGLQELYKNPFALADEDPHFFDFLMEALHGKGIPEQEKEINTSTGAMGNSESGR